MMPPKIAQKLLTRVLREELVEDVLGDLEEKFYKTLDKHSLFRAYVNYWFQTLNYLRPFAMKRRRAKTNATGMLNNNLKVGWRQMTRQKMYSSIKIGGFALGIAASLLITLFIIDELSFDTQPKNADRIYRLYQTYQAPDKLWKSTSFQAPFTKVVKQTFPEVELIGRYNDSELFGVGNAQIRREDQPDNTYEEGITYFDQELVELLELPIVYGNVKTCLDEKNKVVITRKKAEKYWPGEDPVGKLMIYNNDVNNPLKVGAVIEDFPPNSSMQFDFLISMANREMWKGEADTWDAYNYAVYVRLRADADPKEFEKKLIKIAELYFAPTENRQEWLSRKAYALQPFKDIHLKSAKEEIWSSLPRQGDMRFIWLFGAVAVFIVLIACVNFINLSTAKSASRAKEVGLRKTVGSYRANIITQFLVESLIYSVISFVIGIVLAWLILPNFNDLTGKSIVFPWTTLWFAPVMLIASIVVGFFAGLYPSFYLSSFKPVEVLKGSFARSNKNAATRSALVVFQFTTSVVLIIATVVIYRQMNHILDTKLGYDKDQVLIIKGTGTLGNQIQSFKEELLNMSTVKSATVSDYLPVWGTKRNQNGFNFKEDEKRDNINVGAQFWQVDADFAKTLDIKVLEGRFFDKNIASDSDAIVINKKMAEQFGLKDPIGKEIANWRKWRIIGVVEDFYFESMRGPIDPLSLVVWKSSSNTMAVKLNTEDMQGTLAAIERTWRKFSPHQPIRTAFLDDSFARMYDDVRRMGNIFTVFATFAIFVACLGLFALSAFTVEQRGKEISIRLVLGASVRSIFRLLTMNFVKLVLISILIAAPAAWYLMNEWLKGFANQTNLGWDVFVLAGGIAVAIAMVTISYQSIRAGLVKPVDNLRSE